MVTITNDLSGYDFNELASHQTSSFHRDLYPGHRFAVLSSFSESVNERPSREVSGVEASFQHATEGNVKYDKNAPVPGFTAPFPKPTTKQFILACIMCLSLGMTNFYTYSAVLNSSNSVQTYIYPEHQGLADSVTALFMTSDFLITLLLSFTGSLNQYLIVLGILMMSLGTLSLALVCHYVPGVVGVTLFHILCFIVGSGSSISCSASFTLANGLRNPTFAATVSTGGGFVGVISFLMWIILTRVCFNYDFNGIGRAVWVIFGIGSAFQLNCLCCFFIFTNQKWVRESVNHRSRLPPSKQVDIGFKENMTSKKQLTSQSHDMEKHIDGQEEETLVVSHQQDSNETIMNTIHNNNNSFVLPDRCNFTTTNDDIVFCAPKKPSIQPYNLSTNSSSLTRMELVKTSTVKVFRRKRQEWIRVISACYPAFLCAFFALFTTYFLFPVVGPNHWIIEGTRKDILTGAFQFGDFSGRYIPVFATWVPFVMPKIKNSFIIIGARLGFVVTFFLTQHFYAYPILKDLWFQLLQIFAIGFTAGWMATLAMIYSPRYLPDDDAVGRSQANSFGVLGILGGVSCGQWISYGINHLFD